MSDLLLLKCDTPISNCHIFSPSIWKYKFPIISLTIIAKSFPDFTCLIPTLIESVYSIHLVNPIGNLIQLFYLYTS